jgi:hypothetical protein
MALFSIRNERDLIVLSAIASEQTAATFVATASAGEGQVFNQYGNAPTGEDKFAVYVKHLDGRVRKSDTINPEKITYFKKVSPTGETLPSATVTVGAAVVGDLYEIMIRIWNDGSLGKDDVMFLNGSYTAVTGDTTTSIALALANNLKAAQTKMGQSWFTITPNAAVITLQSTALPFVVGKKDGRAIEFAVKASEYTASTLVLGATMVIALTGYTPNPCSLNFIKDLEWQTRGAFGDTYRGLMYPYDFAIQSDVVDGTTYTLYEIDFYDGDEHNHAVQQSPRHLTIAVPAASVTAFDAILSTLLSSELGSTYGSL